MCKIKFALFLPFNLNWGYFCSILNPFSFRHNDKKRGKKFLLLPDFFSLDRERNVKVKWSLYPNAINSNLMLPPISTLHSECTLFFINIECDKLIEMSYEVSDLWGKGGAGNFPQLPFERCSIKAHTWHAIKRSKGRNKNFVFQTINFNSLLCFSSCRFRGSKPLISTSLQLKCRRWGRKFKVTPWLLFYVVLALSKKSFRIRGTKQQTHHKSISFYVLPPPTLSSALIFELYKSNRRGVSEWVVEWMFAKISLAHFLHSKLISCGFNGFSRH